jgi:hypothetical protein
MSGKDEVSICKRGWDCLAIQAGRVDSSIAVIEREIVGTGFGEGEVEDFPAGHCVRLRAQGQRELVMNAGYAAGAVFGQCARNSWSGERTRGSGRGSHRLAHGGEEEQEHKRAERRFPARSEQHPSS